MTLDPTLKPLLDGLAQAPPTPLWDMPIEEARGLLATLSQTFAPAPRDMASVADADADGVPVRVYRPKADGPLPILVCFHGGGWSMGSIDENDGHCRALAHDTPAVVVNVGYRKAPEHRFPAAVDDCLAATRWAAASAHELGAGTGARLAVTGDSAGGNLAAAVCLLARDAGGPDIAFQALVYPALDAGASHPSFEENGEGYLLTADTMRWYWREYLGDAAGAPPPHASPIDAPDLRGLPPALIITAEYDPLRDEGEAYGARLREAGVDAVTSRYQGMIHGFLMLDTLLWQAARAREELSTALREALTASVDA